MDENVSDEVTPEVTDEVTKTGTVLGHDSWKDFDTLQKGGNGKFEGLGCCSSKFGFDEVTVVGRGRKRKKTGDGASEI